MSKELLHLKEDLLVDNVLLSLRFDLLLFKNRVLTPHDLLVLEALRTLLAHGPDFAYNIAKLVFGACHSLFLFRKLQDSVSELLRFFLLVDFLLDLEAVPIV